MMHAPSRPSLHPHHPAPNSGGMVTPSDGEARTKLAVSTLAIALLLVATVVWLIAAYL